MNLDVPPLERDRALFAQFEIPADAFCKAAKRGDTGGALLAITPRRDLIICQSRWERGNTSMIPEVDVLVKNLSAPVRTLVDYMRTDLQKLEVSRLTFKFEEVAENLVFQTENSAVGAQREFGALTSDELVRILDMLSPAFHPPATLEFGLHSELPPS